MDNEQIKLIAHFKILYGREKKSKMDLLRFANDRSYARELLESAMATENEELLVTAIRLMELHGPISTSPAKEPSKAVDSNTQQTDDNVKNRYTRGVR